MIAAIGIPMVVSALIRNLDDFTFLSLTANIALTVSVFVILCFTFTHLNLTEPGYGGRIKDLPFAASVSSLPLFFGTVAFSFENIGAVSDCGMSTTLFWIVYVWLRFYQQRTR